MAIDMKIIGYLLEAMKRKEPFRSGDRINRHLPLRKA
jgi:hypothetical protein